MGLKKETRGLVIEECRGSWSADCRKRACDRSVGACVVASLAYGLGLGIKGLFTSFCVEKS